MSFQQTLIVAVVLLGSLAFVLVVRRVARKAYYRRHPVEFRVRGRSFIWNGGDFTDAGGQAVTDAATLAALKAAWREREARIAGDVSL